MKACLVFPRTTVFEHPLVFPPLGLFYLRAVLEQAGHTTTFVDLSEHEDITALPLDADVYCVSGTSPQAREIRAIGRYLQAHGKLAIVGGPHATNYAGPTSSPHGFAMAAGESFDAELVSTFPILVKGEGERAILDAIERLDEGQRYMARYGRGLVIQRPNVDDLGALPIPNREAARRYHYVLDGDDAGDRRRGTTMFSSRGCPEECRFCDSPALWGRKVRYVPLPRIHEDLEQIQALGFGAIHFFDDILPLHKGRMIAIANLLLAYGFIWRCFFRVDIMAQYGQDFLHLLHACGLREALVGVESGSQAILDGIHKGTTVAQNTLVRTWCRDVGIRFKASVILGLPGESAETMALTKRWVLDNHPDKVNLCTFIPFTGTPIAKDRAAYDIGWDLDAAALEDHFYAGGWDTLQTLVHTSHVSAAQIQEFYHGFIADLERAGISY